MSLTLVLLVVVVALIFTYINGFHDTANSIATVVATKVLSPGQAVLLAATTNLIGALWGTAVAMTIASGIVDAGVVQVSAELLIGALLGAIVWNLVTWWWGLPSSSSHALIGGLIGAAFAASGNNINSTIWAQGGEHWWGETGVIPMVVLPMIASPLIGFTIAFLFMGALFALMSWFASRTGFLQRFGRTPFANAFFGKAQIVSASAMGISHGLKWIKVLCALTMAAGTASGGWRIIKTLGHKMVRLHPVHGFAAETSAATVIIICSIFGIPVSTTHNVSASIMGVGAAKRFSAIRWTIVERMVWAWILTMPITALMSYGLVRALHGLFE